MKCVMDDDIATMIVCYTNNSWHLEEQYKYNNTIAHTEKIIIMKQHQTDQEKKENERRKIYLSSSIIAG